MLKYFIEIKNRVFLLFILYLFLLFIIYFYKEMLLFLIIQSKNEFNQKNLVYYIFTDVTEIFSVYIKLIFFVSSQIFFFYFIYNLFIFFMPALFKKEYLFYNLFFKLICITWIFSAFIAINIVIPITWDFFLSFQILVISTTSLQIHFEAKLIEYFNFYVYFYLISILYFQLVVFLILIFNYSSMNLINIKKFRKIYYFSFILTATLLCFDILSQLIFSFIFLLIYEFFIFNYLLFKKLR